MIDLKTYSPCSECEHKIMYGHCPMAKRSQCPAFQMTEILQMEPKSIDRIPDELFAEVLRRRGWHGELKQATIVTI